MWSRSRPSRTTATRRSRSDSARSSPTTSTSPRRVTSPKPALPRCNLVEVRVDDSSVFEVGQEIGVADVLDRRYGKADVTGVSKGKGFAGVMKRHNFSGQGASHGNHKKHRAPGSIGACATPPGCSRAPGWPDAWVVTGHHPQPRGGRRRRRAWAAAARWRRPRTQRLAGHRPRGGEGKELEGCLRSKAPLFTADGTAKGDVVLDAEVFGIEPNMAVMHQVVTAQLAGAKGHRLHQDPRRSAWRW
jgi:hypothetical protein